MPSHKPFALEGELFSIGHWSLVITQPAPLPMHASIASPLQLSVVIPTLNEAGFIVETIQAIRATSAVLEIIAVDGGSNDATVSLAENAGARVLHAPQRGRGPQQAFGASHARGSVLWFLHADTRPTGDMTRWIQEALASPAVIGGNFRLVFDGESSAARLLTRVYPHLRLLGLSYGDAGLFLRRSAYEQAGGFRAHPLFEDLDLLRRLRRVGKFRRLDAPLVTSSRRFEGRNFALVFARWTGLQVLFWFGVPPRILARMYPPIRAAKAKPSTLRASLTQPAMTSEFKENKSPDV